MRLLLDQLQRPVVALVVALALLNSVLAIYFSAEVTPVPRNSQVAIDHPLTRRLVLIVVDGLRYDTALESGLMPGVIADARRGAAGMALASQVTMTGVGVRAIGTGVSPGLSDLLRNLELPPVEFDNLFARLTERGERVALVGDRPAWMGLFGRYIAIEETSSVQIPRAVNPLDTVYGADAVWTPRAEHLMKRDDFTLGIVMLGGVDHASHLWTPFSPLFRKKVVSTDSDLARIVRAAPADTTFILTSDHGAGASGHHGSGEPEARKTPLVLFGPGIRAGVRLEDARQTDIAATMATLLGLPIPAPSEGRVLVEALDVSADARAQIVRANVEQLQRYATAYARARKLEPPLVEASRLHAVADWIEATRSAASAIPFLWALVLVVIAIGLVLGHWSLPLGLSSLCILLASAASLLSNGRSPWFPAVALLAATAQLALEARGRPLQLRWSRWIVLVGILELASAKWRLDNRRVQLFTHELARHLHLSPDLALSIAIAAILVPFTLWARRRWAGRQLDRYGLLVLLFVLSAANESLALPIGIGAVAVVCSIFEPEVALVLAAFAVGVGGIVVSGGKHGAALHLEMLAPLLTGVLAWWATPDRRRTTSVLFMGLALYATLLEALGMPARGFVPLVGIGPLAVLYAAHRETGRTRWLTLGWGLGILLAALCRSTQIPGLVGWLLTASFLSALPTLREDGIRPLALAVVGCVGIRLGFFGIFEGAFDFSHLEIELGYVGNPETAHWFGAFTIGLKFLLPMILVLALVTAEMRDELRFEVIGLCAAFWSLRIGHVVASMTIARGTFYSPYADSGHLGFMLLMLASTMLAALVLRLVGPITRVKIS